MEHTLNQMGDGTQRTNTEPPVPSPAPNPVPLEPPDAGITEPADPASETEKPEQELNPLGSESTQEHPPVHPHYSGLSYRSASPQSQLDLVSNVYTDQEIDDRIGDTFGPITMAVHPVNDDPRWFQESVEVRFDTPVDVEFLLIEPEKKGDHPAYEASIVLKVLSEQGAAHLKKGIVKSGDPRATFWCIPGKPPVGPRAL